MGGRLIALEGGESAGKSTQAARLAERLDAVLTHEPGATEIGRAIRRLLLDPTTAGLHPWTEALLMCADRAQHVAEVIRPALAAGRDVVTDRYTASSLAYQGIGRGLGVEPVRELCRLATGGLEPDVVVLLEVPPPVAAGRRVGRPDRMEAESRSFHERVAQGFAALAAAEPERWVVVDGSRPADEVTAEVWTAVSDRLAAGIRSRE